MEIPTVTVSLLGVTVRSRGGGGGCQSETIVTGDHLHGNFITCNPESAREGISREIRPYVHTYSN